MGDRYLFLLASAFALRFTPFLAQKPFYVYLVSRVSGALEGELQKVVASPVASSILVT